MVESVLAVNRFPLAPPFPKPQLPRLDLHPSLSISLSQNLGFLTSSILRSINTSTRTALSIPAALFVVYLGFYLKKNIKKLIHCPSHVMIAYYLLLWFSAILNLTWCSLQKRPRRPNIAVSLLSPTQNSRPSIDTTTRDRPSSALVAASGRRLLRPSTLLHLYSIQTQSTIVIVHHRFVHRHPSDLRRHHGQEEPGSLPPHPMCVDLCRKFFRQNPDKWRNMSVSANGQGPREKSRTPKPKTNTDSPATPMAIGWTTPGSSAPFVADSAASTDVQMEDSSKCLLDGKTASKYNTMIYEALSTMKDAKGSDTSAIVSFIEVQNCYRLRREVANGSKAPILKPKEIRPRISQVNSYLGGTLEEAAVFAAYKVAEAITKSFVAA
ncbi:hypothetical protein L1887_03992 [Cichorium endivia]|nr:hypothetical protein L1887_03992 [Cichorium endivia]